LGRNLALIAVSVWLAPSTQNLLLPWAA